MNFHYPEALAAVRDETGAYHIREDGSPAYSERFQDTAGFYEGWASVRGARGSHDGGVRGSSFMRGI